MKISVRGGGKVRALLIMDIQKGYFEEYDTDLLNKINQRILQAIENQEQIIYVKNIKKLRSGIKIAEWIDGLRVC